MSGRIARSLRSGPPVVVKPRFGSGGSAVTLCPDEDALCETLARLSDQPWFEQQGELVQELVPPRGYDLRILVAGQRIAGAIFRIAAEGEWRTSIACGAWWRGARRLAASRLGSSAASVRDRPRRSRRCGRGARRCGSRAERARRLDRHRTQRRRGIHARVPGENPSSSSRARHAGHNPPPRASSAGRGWWRRRIGALHLLAARHPRMIPACDLDFRLAPSPSSSPTLRARRGCSTSSAPMRTRRRSPSTGA